MDKAEKVGIFNPYLMDKAEKVGLLNYDIMVNIEKVDLQNLLSHGQDRIGRNPKP